MCNHHDELRHGAGSWWSSLTSSPTTIHHHRSHQDHLHELHIVSQPRSLGKKEANQQKTMVPSQRQRSPLISVQQSLHAMYDSSPQSGSAMWTARCWAYPSPSRPKLCIASRGLTERHTTAELLTCPSTARTGRPPPSPRPLSSVRQCNDLTKAYRGRRVQEDGVKTSFSVQIGHLQG